MSNTGKTIKILLAVLSALVLLPFCARPASAAGEAAPEPGKAASVTGDAASLRASPGCALLTHNSAGESGVPPENRITGADRSGTRIAVYAAIGAAAVCIGAVCVFIAVKSIKKHKSRRGQRSG